MCGIHSINKSLFYHDSGPSGLVFFFAFLVVSGLRHLTCAPVALLADIVFCRTWVPVEPKKFYNPVTSLLGRLSNKPATAAAGGGEEGAGEGEKGGAARKEEGADAPIGWVAMRSTGQLRKDNAVPVPKKPDSVYKVCHLPLAYCVHRNTIHYESSCLLLIHDCSVRRVEL